MQHTYKSAQRFAALLLLLISLLTASAQTKQKATFSTPDLQVFEVKGHVKKITWKNFFCDDDYYSIQFNEDGSIYTTAYYAESDYEIKATYDKSKATCFGTGSMMYIRNNQGCIEYVYDKELYDEVLESGCSDYGAMVPYSRHHAKIYKWKDRTLFSKIYELGADDVAYGKYNKDGFEVGYMGFVYSKIDEKGNWTQRHSEYYPETRTIEYYTFEEDFERYMKGEGSLDDIAKVIGSLERAKEYSMKTQAEDLWNQRAVEMCRNSRDITADLDKVMKARVIYESPTSSYLPKQRYQSKSGGTANSNTGTLLATATTKNLVIEIWNDTYRTKLQNADEPTELVSEILDSRFATDALKQTALNHWNEYYKQKVERADNQTECAATIIDHSFLTDDNRTYILALVHNYELEHHINGVTDYEALYREANVKCGDYYVFSNEERKNINHNADQYKRQTTNELIVRSQQLMREERYDESRDCALKALAIEPDYSSALDQRAEVEYRILWRQILAYEATPGSINTYMHNNSTSKYNHDLLLVHSLLEHLDHKFSGPRKLYKKMVKKNTPPKPELVDKAVSKCKAKDAAAKTK